MKKYTQAEFDALPVVDGYKQCPTGDYRAISAFPEDCHFGEWCSFGEGCRFGERCSFEGGYMCSSANPFFAADRMGSDNRKTYFFDLDDGIRVRDGCFVGTEAEFIAKLESDDDAAKTEIYMAALALAKLQFAYNRSEK